MNRREQRGLEAAHWRRERRQETERDTTRRAREQGEQKKDGNR
jgi:hypothetical protein